MTLRGVRRRLLLLSRPLRSGWSGWSTAAGRGEPGRQAKRPAGCSAFGAWRICPGARRKACGSERKRARTGRRNRERVSGRRGIEVKRFVRRTPFLDQKAVATWVDTDKSDRILRGEQGGPRRDRGSQALKIRTSEEGMETCT